MSKQTQVNICWGHERVWSVRCLPLKSSILRTCITPVGACMQTHTVRPVAPHVQLPCEKQSNMGALHTLAFGLWFPTEKQAHDVVQPQALQTEKKYKIYVCVCVCV